MVSPNLEGSQSPDPQSLDPESQDSKADERREKNKLSQQGYRKRHKMLLQETASNIVQLLSEVQGFREDILEGVQERFREGFHEGFRELKEMMPEMMQKIMQETMQEIMQEMIQEMMQEMMQKMMQKMMQEMMQKYRKTCKEETLSLLKENKDSKKRKIDDSYMHPRCRNSKQPKHMSTPSVVSPQGYAGPYGPILTPDLTPILAYSWEQPSLDANAQMPYPGQESTNG
ncbi:hypothetical protein BDV33DRAFT_210751 [Aspergillus novoparasiticus]|uniref:BZIP domain-containing protein n=1 Tax=Aspergillus novoparasiticus TaxID=986946 RepID=A0A5N6E6F0_9EURO|nr:hypothetical protein BDV33DRAFT_210751 [Aspergillus novoparasiticus]